MTELLSALNANVSAVSSTFLIGISLAKVSAVPITPVSYTHLCDNEETLRKMMENGMNVARFNFSHGSYEEHLSLIHIFLVFAKQKSELVRGEAFASLFLRSKNTNAYLYAMLMRGEDFASLFLLRIYCNRIYAVSYTHLDVYKRQ